MKLFKMSYEEAYYKVFMKLPKILSIFWGALLALIAIIDLAVISASFGWRYYGGIFYLIGIRNHFLAVVVWLIIICLTIFLVRFFTTIMLSWKVMVVERLTQIRDKSPKVKVAPTITNKQS